jgi:hypothetical protein
MHVCVPEFLTCNEPLAKWKTIIWRPCGAKFNERYNEIISLKYHQYGRCASSCKSRIIRVSINCMWYYSPNCVYPNPAWQLALWEETFDRVLTDSFHPSENRTHDLRGERRLIWRLRHRNPLWSVHMKAPSASSRSV